MINNNNQNHQDINSCINKIYIYILVNKYQKEVNYLKSGIFKIKKTKIIHIP